MTNLRRFLVVSFFLSMSVLRSAAQSQPPPCAESCTTSAASQAGCNIYQVACFCGNTQFLSIAEGCIQQTCVGSDIQDATNFIVNLCTDSSVSLASSSKRPFATTSASQNAAASLKRDMALLGGALGALQVMAAIT